MKEIQKKIKSFLENRPVIKNNDSPEKLVYKLKGEVQELFDEVKSFRQYFFRKYKMKSIVLSFK
jgi:NTP pyrophosphatase (non-canonical NTP hydrolase)